MVLLLCLAFFGQAMASTIMSYHMMSMTGMNGQSMSQDMAMMDHSNHNMPDASAENSTAEAEAEEECCTETCNCFTGGCSNVAAFMTISGSTPIISLSAKIHSYSSLAQSQQPVSLYRPPIIS